MYDRISIHPRGEPAKAARVIREHVERVGVRPATPGELTADELGLIREALRANPSLAATFAIMAGMASADAYECRLATAAGQFGKRWPGADFPIPQTKDDDMVDDVDDDKLERELAAFWGDQTAAGKVFA